MRLSATQVLIASSKDVRLFFSEFIKTDFKSETDIMIKIESQYQNWREAAEKPGIIKLV